MTTMIAISPTLHQVKAQATQQPTLTFDPSVVNETQMNQTFTLNIHISNVQNLWGYSANVTYDSAFLQFRSGSDGPFLTSQGATDLFALTKPHAFNPTVLNLTDYQVLTLTAAIDSYSNGEDDSISGSGVLATVTFQIVNQTSSTPVVLGVEQLEGPLATDVEVSTPNPIITPVSDTSTATVSLIIPGPPTANAGTEQSVPAGTTVTLDGSGSVSSGSNTTYTWTFTDGGKLQTLNGEIANYTFNNPGNYTVTLTVTDSLGTSNSTVVINVMGASATATPTPNTTSTTPTPTNTSSGTTSTQTATATPTETPTSSPDQRAATFNLPPVVTGILIFVTLCTLAGSFFWLRKQTQANSNTSKPNALPASFLSPQ